MPPRFSIITCTWNSQPWLAESIASVLQQQGPAFEMIFVDGGSTDNTLEQIAAIKRPVKLIRNVRNGISDAMNQGLAAASGEIIAHLHSDDFYLRPTVLSLVDQYMRDSHCRWLFGRTQRAINGQLLPEGWTAPPFSRQRLLRGNFIPHPATFVERDLMIALGGFDTRLRYAMDYDLWLRIAALARPMQLSIPLAAFREHAGSLSTCNRLAAMHEDLQVRLRHATANPLGRALHVARYLVRRQRARQFI
ncbi:MAG: glycosyltransferase family 2 protein [Burkholderiaceae bacterium]|jgi:glycosyltransferase involved in cell wall biosynthesis